MPEVYTLRAPENFNNNNNRRSSSVSIKNIRNNYDQNSEMKYLRLPSSSIVLRSPSSPIHRNSNSRLSTATINTKRKSPISYKPLHEQKTEMYYLNTEGKKPPEYTKPLPSKNDTQQKPKLNGILVNRKSPQKKITTYMVAGSNEDKLLSSTSSPSSIRSNKKKQFVSFNTDDHDVSNKQHHSLTIRYVPLSKSKAIESIQRSMNIYRFRRN